MATATQAIEYLALLTIVGAIAFRWIVLPRASVSQSLAATVSSDAAKSGAIAAGVLAAVDVVRFWLQAGSLNIELSTVITQTGWGRGLMMQLVAAIVAGVSLWFARRVSAWWWVAGLAALPLIVSPALGGHAIASQWSSTAVAIDAAHVLGAAGWLGALFILVTVAVPAALATAEEAVPSVVGFVNAFSPAALVFAGIVVVTGLMSAWMRLLAIAPLWSTTYGRVLLVKLAFFVAVAATGAFNWRRVRPVLASSSGVTTLRSSARWELGFALVVIIVTAVLVGVPTPVS